MTFPRILSSSKFQASFVSTVLSAIPLYFTLSDKNLDREHKQQASIAFIIFTSGVWGVSIHGTAKEDAAGKTQQTPDVQVNSGDTQTISSNTPAAQPLAAPPATPAALNLSDADIARLAVRMQLYSLQQQKQIPPAK